MSLVHEALQKAEREKHRKAGLAPAAPAPTPTAPPDHTPTVPAPTVHASTPTVPPSPLGRAAAAPEPAPTAPEPAKANSYLLPALIGCVAIVAIIAIVFLVTNATSVLRRSKEIASAHAASPAPVASPASTPAPTPEVQSTEPAPATGSHATQVSAAPSAPPPGPTAPAVADDSKYKLSGIMTDPDGKFVAVLNGRVAYEGYYIDGVTVKKIERNRVTIDDHGHEAVLRLF